MGVTGVARGDICWYTFRAPDKRRPVLLLARDEVLPVLGEVVVVPATRTIRGLATEMVLGPEDGMPALCALNFDHLSLARKDRIGPRICALPVGRWHEVRKALLAACGFAE
jgi:mRNA interferase MazF